jgi:hypothetical protein
MRHTAWAEGKSTPFAAAEIFACPREKGGMDRTFLAGAALSVAGIGGYLAGVAVAYPGRAFSLTAGMVGITLVAVGDHRRERP